MNAFYFIITTLAVWRLSYLFSSEDGPFNLIYLLRQKTAAGFFGSLLNCFYCTSMWVAFPFGLWLGNTWVMKLVVWLALSGAACLLQKATSRETNNTIPYFEEDKENQQDSIPLQ